MLRIMNTLFPLSLESVQTQAIALLGIAAGKAIYDFWRYWLSTQNAREDIELQEVTSS